MKDIVTAAHAARSKILLDVYDRAGVLPLDLASLEVDFAIGSSYKYTRGGAPALEGSGPDYGAFPTWNHPRAEMLRNNC